MLYQTDDFRYGTFSETLGGSYADDTAQVDASGHDLVIGFYHTRHAFSGQRNGIQRRTAFCYYSVQWNLFSGADNDVFSYLDFIGRDGEEASIPFYVGCIRADVHQMGDAVTASAFCIVFEQFTNLKEKHDKHGLGKFRFSPWEKTDAKGTDGGQGHQEMLIEPIAFGDAFAGFSQGVVTDKQIRNQIDRQQL